MKKQIKKCGCQCHALEMFGWDQKTKECQHCQPSDHIEDVLAKADSTEENKECSCSCHKRMQTCDLTFDQRQYFSFCCDKYQVLSQPSEAKTESKIIGKRFTIYDQKEQVWFQKDEIGQLSEENLKTDITTMNRNLKSNSIQKLSEDYWRKQKELHEEYRKQTDKYIESLQGKNEIFKTFIL